MKKSCLLGAMCTVIFSLATMPANAALIGRLPITPGGTDYQAAYDDVLDITWVTNATLSGNYLDNYAQTLAWAENLNYLGFDDWRLASMSVAAGLPTGSTASVIDCSTATELACRDNELGYMYYHNLGGIFGDDLTGTQIVGDVALTNIQKWYWSGTYLTLGCCGGGWGFFFNTGGQDIDTEDPEMYPWAVRSGDVGVIPVPAAVWLFGSGLLGLVGISRRKKAP